MRTIRFIDSVDPAKPTSMLQIEIQHKELLIQRAGGNVASFPTECLDLRGLSHPSKIRAKNLFIHDNMNEANHGEVSVF